jgi:thiol-disulfide isomerase/thioredoxin
MRGELGRRAWGWGLVLLAAGLLAGPASGQEQGVQSIEGAESGEESFAVTVGDTLPTFMLPLHGAERRTWVAMRDYAGQPRAFNADAPRKVLVLSFFATWCVPCREEIPKLEELAGQWGDEVKVLLISVGDKPEQISGWLEQYPTDLPILMDRYKSTAVERYGVSGLPSLFVVDPGGILRYAHSGYQPGDELEVDSVVRALLN